MERTVEKIEKEVIEEHGVSVSYEELKEAKGRFKRAKAHDSDDSDDYDNEDDEEEEEDDDSESESEEELPKLKKRLNKESDE
mmetsp:Transcript_31170/g.38054  ORF Transcript_31170/g.38054 Transcript_31170/m.38054 type:complete len:82 (+) Transcript_31170:2-247(+)